MKDRSEEAVRDLGQDARAVSRAFIGAHGAAVFQVAQGHEGLLHNAVFRDAAQRGHDGQATGVLLVFGAVQAGFCRHRGEAGEGRDGLRLV